MKFRIIISENSIKKLETSDTINNLEEFKELLTQKLGISGEFSIQYADPDFGNEFCDLNDTEALSNTNTLKIISERSARAEILPEEASSAEAQSPRTTLRISGELPNPYLLPVFDLHIRLVLVQKQKEFDDTSLHFCLPKMKRGKF